MIKTISDILKLKPTTIKSFKIEDLNFKVGTNLNKILIGKKLYNKLSKIIL
jgi:hypothetical protein